MTSRAGAPSLSQKGNGMKAVLIVILGLSLAMVSCASQAKPERSPKRTVKHMARTRGGKTSADVMKLNRAFMRCVDLCIANGETDPGGDCQQRCRDKFLRDWDKSQ